MKTHGKIILAALVLLAISRTAFGNAAAIDIIGQAHEVRGGIFWNDVLSEYDVVGTLPVEGKTMGSQARAGNLSVYADASGDDVSNIKGAYARSGYAFLPEYSDLMLTLSGYIWFTIPETYVSAFLVNTQEGVPIVNFRYSSNSGLSRDLRDDRGFWHYNVEYILTGLNTNHLYELELKAQASMGDGGSALLDAEFTPINTVPTPSAAVLAMIGTALVIKFKI